MPTATLERIPFTCTSDCGGHCELVACVQDGQLVRIDTPPNRPDTDELPRLIPCIRGRAHRRLLSSQDRLRHPLRRVGARGSGEFERVSWDAALDEVAERLTALKREHGPEALLHIGSSGSLGGRGISGASTSRRFFSFWGGVTGTYGHMSAWCEIQGTNWTLGRSRLFVRTEALRESRLILLWGCNPAELRRGVNLAYGISRARDAGAKVVLIDPRCTDTGVLADQWIPIRPGTDVALVAAIAQVWEDEGLVDGEFMATHTVGYDDYRSYVLGSADGVPKTPEWASEIAGAPAEVIRQLAREYAASKPAIILKGLGPQRSLYGEQTERALLTLAAMSGNMGTRGGGLAGHSIHARGRIPLGEMPQGPHRPTRAVRSENWARFLLDGDLDPPVKMAYVVAANAVVRSTDTHANIRAMEGLDFVVVQDQFLTPTARHADLVLPVCMDIERTDLVAGGADVFYTPQVVAPAGESKTDYWVFAQLAGRLGFGPAYTQELTEEGWIDRLLHQVNLDVRELQSSGIQRYHDDAEERAIVDLGDFVRDPARHPLDTPSGLVEIASDAAIKHGLPHIPSYIDSRPGHRRDHPLQLVTPHNKLRANSSLHPNAWLQRLEPHTVWINPRDAARRSIADGDLVKVYSPKGVIARPAKVTPRIIPGVVCIYQGVWFEPDENRVDRAGCANVLTSHDVSPTGGMAVHSQWVQVRRAEA